MISRGFVNLSRFVLSVALIVLASHRQGIAELVLRLDAMNTSSLSLSASVTSGTYSVGGFPFTDPRATGLHFVEGWAQTNGATANPNLDPIFTPLPDPNGLLRPTYDPNGLGAGRPSVNFDYSSTNVVLSQGQWLAASLDNLIYNDKYSIFYVASAPGDSRAQTAFGQDFDFRPEGWTVGMTAGNRWSGRINGNVANNTTSSAVTSANATSGAANNIGAAVRALVSDGTSVDFDTTNATGTTLTFNTVPTAPNNISILSAGDFSIGNRGGTAQTSSQPFNGKISEIAIFNTQLDITQAGAINAYLANKWLGAPAPSPTQLSTALNLLGQPAPATGSPQLVRYQFNPTNPDGTTRNQLVPEVVGAGLTASNFGTGAAPVGENPPDGISFSTVGISANSAFLADTVPVNTKWVLPSEQSPATGQSNYLSFTVTPDAGKQIDPSQLAFTLARATTLTSNPADAANAPDSYGVWINSGSGFVKVAGQVGVAPPLDSTIPVNGFFDTYTADLSSVAAFTQATEIRIYLWHNGAQTNSANWQARMDNFRLLGDVQPLAAGTIGDYNNDGKVDAADYVVWRKNEGTNAVLANDPIGGTIGTGQYSQWRSHFGLSAGSGLGGFAAVPEPAAVALLLVAVFGCVTFRSRQVRQTDLIFG
jgi:hypothetical protein